MTVTDFFDQLEFQYKNELPFVVYRKPNDLLLTSLLQGDTALHEVTDFTESGFVFAPFSSKHKAILIPDETLQSINFELHQIETSQHVGFDVQQASQSTERRKEKHINLVEKTVKAIDKGDLQKVVISRKESLKLTTTISDTSSVPFTIFKKLLKAYQSAFVYCWYHPKVGLWLGATPETLLKLEGRKLSTMSLAGTQPFVDTYKVAWGEKEKNEQQMVTNFIVDSLQSVLSTDSAVNNSVKISEAKTVRAGNLLHLKTDISANLQPKSLNLQEIVQNLHPTPAICGLPKTLAENFILDHEGYDREYYTGFLGELNFTKTTSRNPNKRNVENNAYASVAKISTLYVNLRCMQLKADQAIIYVGGGITKDSSPESEWEETVSKSRVIKSVL